MKQMEWLKETVVGVYYRLEEWVVKGWQKLNRRLREGEKTLVEELAERKKKDDSDLLL